MKNLLLLLITACFLTASVFAQSGVTMQRKYGAESSELQGVLYFENIALERLLFSGSELKNKNYQIYIQKIVNGNLADNELVFDSKEMDFFKITGDRLAFRVFAQETPGNTVKFEFQFDGFRHSKEYRVTPEQKNFALKNFMAGRPEQSISLIGNNHILAFMMPYVKADKSTAYCEVVQSGVSPEDLGRKYPIPLYFLIDIKFD